MPKTRYLAALFLLGLLLAPPAFGSALEQIEKEYGVALDEQPVDTCKLNNVAAPCYIPYPPGNVIVPAATPDSLRQELDKAGLKKKEAAAEDSAAVLEKRCQAELQADAMGVAGPHESCKKLDALNHPAAGPGAPASDFEATEQTCKTVDEQFSKGRGSAPPKIANLHRACEAMREKRLADQCSALKDKDAGSDDASAKKAREACADRDDRKLGLDRSKLTTPQECKTAMEAQQKAGDQPGAKQKRSRLSDLCGPVVADMLKNITEKKQEYPAGVLAWFQGQCPNPDLRTLCLALGHKMPDAAPLGVKLDPERKALETACANGSDPGACDTLSRLAVKEELDKRPDVKHKIQRAKAYDADTEQAARYDAYIQRHFKDPKQQDLMERLMRANPETMGKLMERNTQCEKTKNAAACERKFYSNYRGLANGRPVSDVGRRYLANMCAMPENKDVEACKRPENYRIAKKRHSVPAPAAAPRRAAARPQTRWSFGGFFGKGCYLKGMTPPVSCASGEPNCVCE